MSKAIEFQIIENPDDDENEYIVCPICEGNPFICRGDCIDVGFGPTYQISPDEYCKVCDETGMIKVGSEAHYSVLCDVIMETITDAFGGQEFIDNLPKEKFEKFYKYIVEIFGMIRPLWLKNNGH